MLSAFGKALRVSFENENCMLGTCRITLEPFKSYIFINWPIFAAVCFSFRTYEGKWVNLSMQSS